MTNALNGLTQAQQRANAAAFREVLAGLLADGPMVASKLAIAAGVRPQVIRDYMHRMIKEGRVQSNLTSGPRRQGGGTTMALYSLVPDDSARRMVRNTYPPNKVRDPYALPDKFFARAPHE